MLLVASAAFALSACGGGGGTGQPVTPPSGAGLAPLSVPQHSTSDNARSSDDADGGEDEDGGGGGTVAYNSIPKPLKAVASVGFEATQGLQLGDGVNLAHTGKLQRVRYVLSSWGCQSGNWSTHNCVTNGHPTFPVPFTVNVYAVDNTQTSHVGALLATQTRTFNIPYRPSSDVARCPSGEQFFSRVDNACVHGLANVIAFNFGAPRVSLPAQIIVSLVYNTSHYGPHPIGQSAPCYTSPGGCGYDSLNVSTDGNGGPVGSPVDPNGIFDSFTQAADYCVPAGTGFRLDTAPGCWTGFHPQFEVFVTSGRGSRDED
jgi:hypothetical protein